MKKSSYLPSSLSTIFSGLSFSIFEYGIELASKRVTILSELIRNNGGRYLQFKEVNLDNLPDFVISSKSLNLAVK